MSFEESVLDRLVTTYLAFVDKDEAKNRVIKLLVAYIDGLQKQKRI